MAYNFAKHLKALRWRTPFQAICDARTKEPLRSRVDPHHPISGSNTYAALKARDHPGLRSREVRRARVRQPLRAARTFTFL